MAKAQRKVGPIMVKVFIIHGWAYELDKWQDTVSLLKDNGFNPVLLKVPGLTEQSSEVWTIDKYKTWLDQQLKKETEPVTLLGHSNGGRIAINYSVENPKKVQWLILLDSAGVYHNNLSIRLKRLIFKSISKLGRRFKEVPIFRKVIYKLARESDYRDAPINMRCTMANMLESDKQLDVSKVRVKTTIIWGEQDRITPLADAKTLNNAIKNSTLHIIDGARHAPHFTHSKQLVDIIKGELA